MEFHERVYNSTLSHNSKHVPRPIFMRFSMNSVHLESTYEFWLNPRKTDSRDLYMFKNRIKIKLDYKYKSDTLSGSEI